MAINKMIDELELTLYIRLNSDNPEFIQIRDSIFSFAHTFRTKGEKRLSFDDGAFSNLLIVSERIPYYEARDFSQKLEEKILLYIEELEKATLHFTFPIKKNITFSLQLSKKNYCINLSSEFLSKVITLEYNLGISGIAYDCE